MNLQTQISNSLWKAIQSTYNSNNYSHAILDAMHYLSNVLRDKSGVDGDGASLVGQALGGNSPRLRINKLQTETEQNEQRGIESILRGLYQAVRNPRSHEQVEDTQATADSIICFINYLLGIIEKSEEPFVLSKFLTRVFDQHFYNSQYYAELLVSEIPANKWFDTLVAVYREKLRGDIYSIGLVIGALIDKLSDDQVKQFLAIVSDEMTFITDETDIRYNLQLLPPKLWEQLSEASKLRIENRVICSIKNGRVVRDDLGDGALATWASQHFKNFTLKDQVGNIFIEKLNSNSSYEQLYVIEYFLTSLPKVITLRYKLKKCVTAISSWIREGNERVHKTLIENFNLLPDSWRKQFCEDLKDMTDEENPAVYTPDGIPFLKQIEYKPTFNDDEIPF
jgi:uncharacterized protein (TIGR02391 family)